MKLSPQEKAAHRAAFQNMTLLQKLDHIFTYYKSQIFLILLAFFILGNVVYRQMTKRETVLYAGFLNIAIGEDLEQAFREDYLAFRGFNPKKQEVSLLLDLYLSEDASTENHEYAYASRMKLLGTVNAGQLDVVLMNREAFDLLSRNQYLLDLEKALPGEAPDLYRQLSPYLTSNEVILSDNAIEYDLGEAENREIVKETAVNGIDASQFPRIEAAGFSGTVYLGVIANTRRLPEVTQYLEYLMK